MSLNGRTSPKLKFAEKHVKDVKMNQQGQINSFTCPYPSTTSHLVELFLSFPSFLFHYVDEKWPPNTVTAMISTTSTPPPSARRCTHPNATRYPPPPPNTAPQTVSTLSPHPIAIASPLPTQSPHPSSLRENLEHIFLRLWSRRAMSRRVRHDRWGC